jgi:hypothetical protein
MPSVVIKCGGDIKLQEDFPTEEDAQGRLEMLLAEGSRMGAWEYIALSDLWYSQTMNLTMEIVD